MTDWLAGAVINTMTWIFDGILAEFIGNELRRNIQDGIDRINNRKGPKKFGYEEVEDLLSTEDVHDFLKKVKLF